jgi:multiple sugar transport system permease protein
MPDYSAAVHRPSWSALRAVGAAVLAVAFALPLVFMVSGSLRPPGLPPPTSPQLVPDPLGFGSYGRAFELVDLGRYTLNSLVVAALVVPLTVLVASWAGFAIARLQGRAATLLVAVSVAALMVPATAVLVPRFTLYRLLGVTDTYVPLVAPALLGTSPLYVLLYAVAFRRLPRDLYDACALESLGPFATWRRVAMPLVAPVTAAVAILAFVVSWGSALEPLVYLFDPALYTLPLGLRSLAELDRSDYPVFLAGCVVATAPVLLAFLVAQRWLPLTRKGAEWLAR